MNSQTPIISTLGAAMLSVLLLNGCKDSKTAEPPKTAAKPAAEMSELDNITVPEIPNRPKGDLFTVNGIKMHYEIFGDGPPLLLIHGGAASIESWFAQIPELSKKFKVIAADSRGQGRTSDADGPINFEIMASDYAGLLDHLGLKDVMIVGWSDGGVTGLEMAARRPDLVKKVVTLGTHGRPSGMTDEFKTEVETSTAEKFPAILVEGYKAISPDGPEHWPTVFGKLKTMWLSLPNFTDDELRSIKCPVLMMVGEHDIVREEESKRIAALIPKARLKVLAGASHYSPVEIPDVVNGEITGFFGEP
jgi:pimeloyl-ACP methyl ester carboxylesterase